MKEIPKDIGKEIYKLRYGVEVKSKVKGSMSPRKSTVEISEHFKQKGIIISRHRIQTFLESNLSRLMSLDLYYGVLPDSIKFDRNSKIWLQHRKRIYLYWYKFLQLSLQNPECKVDMKKYKDWGNSNYILSNKFDDWFKEYEIKLFGMKKKTDKPKVTLITNQPKFDAIHLSYKFYHLIKVKGKMYKDIKLDEGVFKNDEMRTGMYQFKGMDNEFDSSSRIRRYVRNGENLIKGVCVGEYPRQMKI